MAGIRGNGTIVERTEPGDATDAVSPVITMQAALHGRNDDDPLPSRPLQCANRADVTDGWLLTPGGWALPQLVRPDGQGSDGRPIDENVFREPAALSSRSKRRSEPRMQIIAHRGCADQYPENTLAAFKQAAPHVDAIEIDARRCGSGELVAFHDERLDRLTDGTGLVAETTWSELQALSVAGSDHGIPRLPALLRAIPDEVGLDIELKEQGLVADVLQPVGSVNNTVTLTANQPTVIEEVVSTGSSHPFGFIFWDDPDAGFEIADRYDCDLLVPEVSLCLETNLIDRAHANGWDVWVWTVADRQTAAQLAQTGADGLIVDRWDVI